MLLLFDPLRPKGIVLPGTFFFHAALRVRGSDSTLLDVSVLPLLVKALKCSAHRLAQHLLTGGREGRDLQGVRF